MGTTFIGSATFVVSENHIDDELITDEQAIIIATDLVSYLNHLLKEKNLDNAIVISGMQWQRGCITIVITFSVIGAVAGGYVLINGIKDYKEVREGLLKIFEDVKNASIWIKNKFKIKRRNKLPLPQPGKDDILQNSDEPFKVMFEQALHNYETMPVQLRKYWSAGQEITISNEKGEMFRYTLALKREDILNSEEFTKPLG